MDNYTIIFKHTDVAKQYTQDLARGKLIAEHNGRKYMCVFKLDASYCGQCCVTTSLFVQDKGWQVVLEEHGNENAFVNYYHTLNAAQQGELIRSNTIEARMIGSMHKCIDLAIQINS